MSEVLPSASLLVLYTERLDDCLTFYAGLGLPLRPEQHATGPAHHAAELGGGLVLELYPGRSDRTTGRLRLGFRVPARPGLSAGRHRLTDPDGRAVVVDAVDGRSAPPPPPAPPSPPHGTLDP